MTSRIIKKVAADLGAAWGRAALVIFAMATGLFGVAWVAETNAILRRELGRSFRAIDPAAAIIRTEAVSDSVIDRLRTVPGVAAVDGGRVLSAVVPGRNERRPVVLFTVRDYDHITVNRLKSETGSWPPPEGAVLLERAAVRVAGIQPGDTLGVRVGNAEAVPLVFAGTVHDFSQAPAWQEGVIYGYVSRATMARLAGEDGLTSVRLTVSERPLDLSHIREVAGRAVAGLERAGGRVRDLEIPPPGEHPHQGQMEALLGIQQTLGAVALLLSGTLVVVLLGAMLAQHRRQIGAMKAIGASRAAIARMYLLWILALAGAAELIALPAAAVAGGAYARFIAEMLNFDILDASVPLSLVLGLILLGGVLPLLVALLPVLRATGMTTRAALADTATMSVRAAAGAKRPVGRLAALGLANAMRVRGRFALVVVTIALGGALFLAAKNLGRSFQGTLAVTVAGMGYDVTLGVDGGVEPARIRAALTETPGVAQVEMVTRARALLAGRDLARPNAFAIRGATPAEPPRLVLTDGRWLTSRDGRSVVANHVWVRDHPEVALGDSIDLTIAGVASRWLLVGTVRELMTGPGLFAPTTALAAAIGGRAHNIDVAVGLTEHGPDAERRAVAAIDRALARAGIASTHLSGLRTVGQSRSDHVLVIVSFLVTLSGLSLVVGGLGLATMLSVGVFERSQEIGVMRSIGATRRQLLVLVLVEGAFTAFAGWIAAVLMSLPLSWLLDRVFGRMMLATPLDFYLFWGAIPALAGLSAFIAVVASAGPAWRASRLEPRALLVAV